MQQTINKCTGLQQILFNYGVGKRLHAFKILNTLSTTYKKLNL